VNGGGTRSDRRVWVGGATGFLGSHLVRALAARGDEVVAISRSGTPDGSVRAVDVLDAGAVEASARGTEVAFVATGKVSRSRDASE
jgi:nucleoside-diphosphate-sugar epimerase